MAGYVAEIFLPNLDLGIDDGLPSDLAQDAAEIGLGCAIAVVRRCIEIVDAQFKRTRDAALLLRPTAPHHQTGIAAAAETNFGKTQCRSRNAAIAHDGLGLSNLS